MQSNQNHTQTVEIKISFKRNWAAKIYIRPGVEWNLWGCGSFITKKMILFRFLVSPLHSDHSYSHMNGMNVRERLFRCLISKYLCCGVIFYGPLYIGIKIDSHHFLIKKYEQRNLNVGGHKRNVTINQRETLPTWIMISWLRLIYIFCVCKIQILSSVRLVNETTGESI